MRYYQVQTRIGIVTVVVLKQELASSTLITLINEENVTCLLTQVNSTLHIKQPEGSKLVRYSPDINMGDWNVSQSVKGSYGPVTDARWNSFSNSTGKNLILRNNPISVSICSSGVIHFQLYSENFARKISLNFTDPYIHSEFECHWFNYTLVTKNLSLDWHWQNGTLAKPYTTNFPPSAVSFNKFPWKLHKYDFLQSNSITKSGTGNLTINYFGKLCVTMFVSLDQYSDLEIVTEYKDKMNKTKVSGVNKPDSLKKWTKITLEEAYHGWIKIYVIRSNSNEKEEGYWAVDYIRFCDKNLGDITNITKIYNTSVPANIARNYKCELENDVSYETETFCNRTGFLGEQCNLSCKKVLGDSYPNCEQYKICSGNRSCQCSWGFKGPACREPCHGGYWGLNCSSKCENGCDNCDKKTGACGKCRRQYFGEKCRNVLPVVRRRPILKSVTANSAVLRFNDMYHNANESSPEFYQIRVKKVEDKIFYNSSDLLPYHYNFTDTEVIIGNLSRDQYSYDVKILLFVKNQSYDLTVPQLRIYKSILKVQVNSNDTILSWTFLEHTTWQYAIVNYACEQTFCSISSRNTLNTTNTSVTIQDMQHLGNCEIEIFQVNQYGALQLFDQISVKFPQIVNISQMEFPKKVELGKHEIVMELRDCSSFYGSISYKINLTCTNMLCENHPETNLIIEKHNGRFGQNVQSIKPSATYEVVITAIRFGHVKTQSYENVTAPFASERMTLEKKTLVIICVIAGIALAGLSYLVYLIFTYKYLFGRCCRHHKHRHSENLESNEELEESKPLSSSMISVSDQIDLRMDQQEHETPLSVDEVDYSSHHPLLPNYNLERTFRQTLVAQLNEGIARKAVDQSNNLLTNDVAEGYKVPRSYKVESLEKSVENLSDYVEQIALLIQTYEKSDTYIEGEDIITYITDALSNKEKIQHQFRSLPEIEEKAMTVGLQITNKNKNRTTNYVPFDFNRVVLKVMAGMGHHHYINASYINGFDRPRAYIAAQSPKFSTVRDFWRMIWQEQVETIVMATNFIENKTRKSGEYYPQNLKGTFECGSMIIKLISERKHEHCDDRTLEVTYNDSSKKIRHFSMKWSPEYSTSLYPNNVLPVVKQIRRCYRKSQAPILIHCSLGINRTGTLILCDLALQMLQNRNGVDFCALLKEMRKQRFNFVKSEQQYVLAFMIVAEYLLDNPFDVSEEQNLIGIDVPKRIAYLEKICWHDEIVQQCRNQKNFTTPKYQYIRADGYGKVGKYLITRQPNKDTITQFWKIIVKEHIKFCVFLNDSTDKDELQMWPFAIEKFSSTVTITLLETYTTDYCTLTILLLECKDEEEVLYKYDISLFVMKNWNPKDNFPPSVKDILYVANDVDKVSKVALGSQPILVACHDGFTASGLFTTLSYITEKYREELKFDVCNGMRMMSRNGAQFRNIMGQMEFVYKCAEEYLQNFDDYSSAELSTLYFKSMNY